MTHRDLPERKTPCKVNNYLAQCGHSRVSRPLGYFEAPSSVIEFGLSI